MQRKMRIFGWLRKLVLLLTALIMVLAPTAPALAIPADELPSQLTLGARAGDDVTAGFGDILIPLSLNESGLLFLNPRFSLNDNDEQEFNLGLGCRRLYPDKPLILGANIWYDSRYSHYDNHYNQLGLGVELLGAWLDARANYYLPEDKKELIASYDTVEKRESGSWGDPYARAHQIKQTSTITTTTTTRTFEKFEQPMRGFDAEVGVRLPLLKNLADIRLFGGYYDFTANYADDLSGFKARVEARILPALTFNLEYYEDKELNGSQVIAGVRVCLPLEFGNLLSSVKEAFKEKEQPPFSSRLGEMVIRDLAVRTDESAFTEDKTKTKTETKAESQSAVLLDDVNFVDGDNAGAEDGTAENPYDHIQEGVNNAFGEQNVYVYAASTDYQENIILTDNVTLIGQGCPIPGMGGKVFGGDARPTVDGMSLGPSITMGHSSTIKGMRVINTDTGGIGALITVFGGTPYEDTMDIRRAGIYANDFNDLTISCYNLVENCEYGALLYAENVPDFRTQVINNNQFINNDEFGLGIGGMGASGAFTTTISDNIFNNNGAEGFGLLAYDYDTVNINIANAAANNNTVFGIGVLVDETQAINAFFNSIQANGNGDDGICAELYADNDIFAGFTNITANDNHDDGIRVDGDGNGNITTYFTNITANDNDSRGVFVALYADDNATILFDNITANDNRSTGLYISPVAYNGDVLAYFSNVTANGTQAASGLAVWLSAPLGTATLFGERNTLLNNFGRGLLVHLATPTYSLDFGGGAEGSLGLNSIYGNGSWDAINFGGGILMAKNNWWGVDPPAAGQFSGSIDYTPWLASDPD